VDVVGVFVQILNRDKGWMLVMGDVSDVDGRTLDVAKQASFIGYVIKLLLLQKPDKAFSSGLDPAETIGGQKCQESRLIMSGRPH
jgi:hypothetical protein